MMKMLRMQLHTQIETSLEMFNVTVENIKLITVLIERMVITGIRIIIVIVYPNDQKDIMGSSMDIIESLNVQMENMDVMILDYEITDILIAIPVSLILNTTVLHAVIQTRALMGIVIYVYVMMDGTRQVIFTLHAIHVMKNEQHVIIIPQVHVIVVVD